MFHSLKFKIIITAFILISIIVIGNTWKDIRLTENKLLNSQKEKTTLLSDRISHGIMILMLKNRWQDLQVSLEHLIKDAKELKEIRIFNPDSGNIIASSDPKEIGETIYKDDMEKFNNLEFDAFLIEKDGEMLASKLTPIENQPVCHQCHSPDWKILGVMDVETSLTTVRETIEEFKREHLIDGVIGFILIIFTFLFIIGILIDRPINKMIGTIKKIEGGDLSARMSIKRKDELGMMAKSFNAMVESLESTKKELEEYHGQQINQAAKLASLGEIASGIAHEIKNPLTGISCAMQVFQSEFSEDDEKRTIIDEILNQIKRLDRTVKDLLRYAKPTPPKFRPYNISDVLDKALFLVYPKAKKQNISIETSIEKDIPLILMDSDQMQQVFLNLIINAAQAMPSGGKLTISIYQKGRREVREEIHRALNCDKMLIIEILDTGEGISPEDINMIFEPFFTNKSKGTGLGLSISQRIVREHQGELTCRRSNGRGTVFTIYLPT